MPPPGPELPSLWGTVPAEPIRARGTVVVTVLDDLGQPVVGASVKVSTHGTDATGSPVRLSTNVGAIQSM